MAIESLKLKIKQFLNSEYLIMIKTYFPAPFDAIWCAHSVRSNTRNIHSSVTPPAARQPNPGVDPGFG